MRILVGKNNVFKLLWLILKNQQKKFCQKCQKTDVMGRIWSLKMGLLNNKIVFLRTISFDPETGEEIKKIKHFYQKKDNQKIDCVQENDHRTNECKFIIYKSDCKTVSVNRLKK